MSRGFVLPSQISPPIAAAGGLVLVTAQTGFTAQNNITSDGVFTSAYTNYKIILNYSTSTTNSVVLRLRVGGVSAATNYNRVFLEGLGSTTSVGTSAGGTSMLIAPNTNGVLATAVIELHRPAEAVPTMITALNNLPVGANYATPAIWIFGNNHSTAAAYDGIELLVPTGTMTGTYTIYGYGKTS